MIITKKNNDVNLINYPNSFTQDIPKYKKGNKIHIKKENIGKFTDYCGGKVTQECISKGKRSNDPKIRKRATFADNARKWKNKYQKGGQMSIYDKMMLLTNIGYISDIGTDEQRTYLDPIPENQLQDPYMQEYINNLYDTATKYLNGEQPLLYDKRTLLPEVSSEGYAPLKLAAWYPITDMRLRGTLSMPIGHSAIYGYGFGSQKHKGTKKLEDEDYNIVTNNCSNETRRILEAAIGKTADISMLTTPGDVRDFAKENGAYIPSWAKDRGLGDKMLYIPMDKQRYENLMKYKNQHKSPKEVPLWKKAFKAATNSLHEATTPLVVRALSKMID